MKPGFHLKLGIAILVVFGLLFAGFAVYPPLRVKWYERGLYSDNPAKFEAAMKDLLALGPVGEEVVRKYFDRPDSGYGKPSNGLVARVIPQTVIFSGGKADISFEIVNISGEMKTVTSSFTDLQPKFYNVKGLNHTFSSSFEHTPKPWEISPGGKLEYCQCSILVRPRAETIVFSVIYHNYLKTCLVETSDIGNLWASFEIELGGIKLETQPVNFRLGPKQNNEE